MSSVWERRKAVQRMQEYIELNLERKITMSKLTNAACYSIFHSAKIFKEITGWSPFEYIRMRRLSAAAEKLVKNNRKIIEIAFDFEFDSHEGFTRAFAKQFGVPPSKFDKIQADKFLFQPPMAAFEYYTKRLKGEISMNENQSKQKAQTVFVQIIERPERKLIFKPASKAEHYFEYCEEVGCDIWEQLGMIKNVLGEPMGLWFPQNLKPENCSTYKRDTFLTAFSCISLNRFFMTIMNNRIYFILINHNF